MSQSAYLGDPRVDILSSGLFVPTFTRVYASDVWDFSKPFMSQVISYKCNTCHRFVSQSNVSCPNCGAK